MTAQELEIAIREHEMQRLELKESFNVECIEAACAFANASGGYIVLGVDNNGNPAKAQLRFEALRDVDAEKVAFRDATVVVLKVPENPLKPVAYKGRSFMRKGSVNHQMTPVEIAECHLKSTGASMDAVIMSGVTRADLDMDEVRKYMAKAIAEGRRNFSQNDDPWLVLNKLQLVKSEAEITRAACLLFAKEPQIMFSQAIIHAGAFRDEGALILDSCDVGGNIQNQVAEGNTTWSAADGGTWPVGTHAPNAWGFYDMHGNVFEMCLDWFEANPSAHGGAVNIDTSAPAKDLSGNNGTYRVCRGGSYRHSAAACRSAYRTELIANGRYNIYGLRIACPANAE